MFDPVYSITHDRTAQSNQQDTPTGVSLFFPSSRGVVELQAHDGSTLLLAATGHIRDYIAQRLNEANEPTAHADLAPVTARVLAQPTGSAIESDLFVLERARAVDPALHRKIAHQNRRALLVLNPDSGTWRTTETTTLERAANERIVGPCLTSRSAQQLGETLDDVYELCRYPRELALAPNGTACAYKQMGRCPGACDGSETMDAYHDRFARAVDAVEGGLDVWCRGLRERMQRASEGLDFEAAALLKRQLDAVDALARDTLGHAASLHAFSCVVVTPAPRVGWAQCWVFNAQGCVPFCSIELLDNELLETLPSLLAAMCTPMGFTQPQLERFAIITRYWLTKPSRQRKRRVSVLDTRSDDWSDGLRPAIEAAQRPGDAGHDDEEHTLLPV